VTYLLFCLEEQAESVAHDFAAASAAAFYAGGWEAQALHDVAVGTWS
jgi:hypothetical protein